MEPPRFALDTLRAGCGPIPQSTVAPIHFDDDDGVGDERIDIDFDDELLAEFLAVRLALPDMGRVSSHLFRGGAAQPLEGPFRPPRAPASPS